MAMLSIVSLSSLKSLRFDPATHRPIGTPPPSVSRLRLVPCLPLSVGFLPTFFPPERGFRNSPVHREPLPIDPAQLVVFGQPYLPQFHEHPGLGPLLEAPVRRGGRADPGLVEGVPLASGAKAEEDGVHGRPVTDPWVVAAQRVRLARGKERLNPLPQLIRSAPVAPNPLLVLGLRAHRILPPVQMDSLPQLYTNSPYWDRLLA